MNNDVALATVIILGVSLVVAIVALVIITIGRMRHNWRVEFERSLNIDDSKGDEASE